MCESKSERSDKNTTYPALNQQLTSPDRVIRFPVRGRDDGIQINLPTLSQKQSAI
jgi:hypothetical protein